MLVGSELGGNCVFGVFWVGISDMIEDFVNFKDDNRRNEELNQEFLWIRKMITEEMKNWNKKSEFLGQIICKNVYEKLMNQIEEELYVKCTGIECNRSNNRFRQISIQ